MKSLILLATFLAFANPLTQEEKDTLVVRDIFQVKYSFDTDYVELSLSGYKLADIDWKDMTVTAYSLKKQVKEFNSLQAGQTLKIPRSVLTDNSSQLRLKIKYKDKTDEVSVPLDK